MNGEMALIMTVYNFKRVISILGFDEFLKKLKEWKPDYRGISPTFLKMTLKRLPLTFPIFQSGIFTQKLRVA